MPMASDAIPPAVPDGWRVVRLGDVAQESRQRAGEERPEVYSVTKHDGFVRSADYFDRQVFSRDVSGYRLVRRREFAYATIHLDEGSLGLFESADAGLISPMYTVFEVDGDQVDRTFLFAYLKQPSMVQKYGRLGDGTVHRRKSIRFRSLARLELNVPPLPEQRGIAAVLDAIDDAIERSEAVIAATEELRRSLLHELLSRGVPGWHSEWREVRGLGVVPACWEVVRLGEVATLQRGMDLPNDDRLPGRVPVYGSNGVHGFHDSTPMVGPGVITGRSGSIGLVHYSESAFWPLNTTLYVSDFHGNNRRFVYYFLIHFRLERFVASTGVPSLNRNFVHPVLVAVPPLAEQDAVATIMGSVDDSIARTRAEHDKLGVLKASAAEALLSGRVRVPTHSPSS